MWWVLNNVVGTERVLSNLLRYSCRRRKRGLVEGGLVGSTLVALLYL